MKITYVHSSDPKDELQVRLRCRNVADAINRVGWHSAHLLDLETFIQNGPEACKVCDSSDLLIVHRYLYAPVFQAIEHWRRRGKKVIVDFDQALDHLPPDIPGYSFWTTSLPEDGRPHEGREEWFESSPLEQFRQGLGMVNGATVPSTRLMMDWLSYTQVHEIPDYLNTDQYPGYKLAHENEVWIGVANDARAASVRDSGLAAALENICRERPQVRLVTSGAENEREWWSRIPASQRVTYRSRPFEEWADILPRLDLGLFPLHGEYDLRMGRIGLLEFMVSKVPWLASHQPVLSEYARYGRLVHNTPGAWESAIVRAMDGMGALQRKAAGEPFLFALSQDINENIDKVLKFFANILNQA